jgi:glycosyltransferase involved in cell wall biosynthesis
LTETSTGPGVLPRDDRVLWVVPVSGIGGVARHVSDVLTAGIPGHELALLVPPGPLADASRAAGHEVVEASFGPAHGLAASLRALRAAVRRTRPAIVHSHLSYADLVVAMLPTASFRRVSTEHGIAADDRVYHSSSAVARLMALAHAARLRRLDALVAVSHATARAVRHKWHPPSRLHIDVLPNGCDPHPVSAVPASPGLRVAALARLAPEKGLLELVDAFAKVRADHPEARLTIAGEGPMEDEVRAKAVGHGLGDVVEMVGFVDGIAGLGDVDVIAQLSVWENCSYTILDAIRAGCGVVATDVGGNAEILPGRCLVARGDLDAAAAALVRQGLEPSLRPKLRDGWPTVADQCAALATVYRRVLA